MGSTTPTLPSPIKGEGKYFRTLANEPSPLGGEGWVGGMPPGNAGCAGHNIFRNVLVIG